MSKKIDQEEFMEEIKGAVSGEDICTMRLRGKRGGISESFNRIAYHGFMVIPNFKKIVKEGKDEKTQGS